MAFEKNYDLPKPIEHAPCVHLRSKAIYVTADECTGISGMDDAEALPLLQRLAAHVVEPRFQYHHKWQVGDVLMWDNCAVQHVVNRDYAFPPDRRMMHRITVGGSVPY